MKSSDLRRLSQAAASEGAHPLLWDAIASRCQDFAEQMRHWDIIFVLQAFTDARVENRQLFLRLADTLCSKTSKLPPKLVLDVFAVYESVGLRPRALYVELFHSTVKLSRAMYGEELSLTLQCLARHRLGNPTVVAHLVSAVFRQLKDIRLRYLCGIAGALGSLEMAPESMLVEFNAHAQFEVTTVAVQELLENLQAFPQLEFSWQPYEELCLHQFREKITDLRTASEVGQLADPFETMHFLRAKDMLDNGFLEALTQWCLAAVHKPNVRSERRPTARQLIQLHDQCKEHGLDSAPALSDTIAHYVESGGGQWPEELPKPLTFNRNSRYVRSFDPLEGLVESQMDALASSGMLGSQQPSPARTVMDLPGLPSSDWGQAPAVWTEDTSEPEAISGSPSEVDLLGKNWYPLRSTRKGLNGGDQGETVGALVSSRRSVRPRHIRDPGLKRMLRKNWNRPPLFMLPGYASRPKYQPGTTWPGVAWKGVPLSSKGASWVLRR